MDGKRYELPTRHAASRTGSRESTRRVRETGNRKSGLDSNIPLQISKAFQFYSTILAYSYPPGPVSLNSKHKLTIFNMSYKTSYILNNLKRNNWGREVQNKLSYNVIILSKSWKTFVFIFRVDYILCRFIKYCILIGW